MLIGFRTLSVPVRGGSQTDFRMLLFAHNRALRCHVVACAWWNTSAARLHNARAWLHNWARYVSVAIVVGATATIGARLAARPGSEEWADPKRD